MHNKKILRTITAAVLAAALTVSAVFPDHLSIRATENTAAAESVITEENTEKITEETTEKNAEEITEKITEEIIEEQTDAAVSENSGSDIESESTADESETQVSDTSATASGTEAEASGTSDDHSEMTDDSDSTEDSASDVYGWVEYVTTEGGSLRAEFEYEGEVYDEGTYTYDMMEYGPWEAQYETGGVVTVTTVADEGCVLETISVTDDAGNVLTPAAITDGDGNALDASVLTDVNGSLTGSTGTLKVSIIPSEEYRTVILAVFSVNDETESESDTEFTEAGIDESEITETGDSETDAVETEISETEAIQTEISETETDQTDITETELTDSLEETESEDINAGIMLADEEDLDSEVEIEAGYFYYYSDGTVHLLASGSAMGTGTGDTYKYVRYKVNGTTYTVSAYCMQHALHAPTSGTTFTTYTDLDGSGDDKYLRKAMFYGYGGPAWGTTINGYNIKSIFDDYGCSSTEYKLMMHYLIDHLYSEGSDWTAGLSSNALSMLSAIKSTLASMPDPAADSITTSQSLTASLTDEGPKSETTKIGSSSYSAWKFTIELEDGVSLVNTTTGKTYTDEGTVYGGDQFYFLATGNTNTLSGSYQVTCSYPLDFHAVALVSSSSDTQDIGFGYYTTDSYLTISVDWPEYGTLTLKKSSSKTSVTNNNDLYTMEGIVYRVYTSYDSSTNKVSGRVSEADLTLDADGVSNTVSLDPGTYYIKEYSVPENSGYIKSTEVYSVTLTEGDEKTLSVTDDPVIQSFQFLKLDEDSLEPIDGTVTYQADFYAGVSTAAKAAAMEAPTRSWVLKTDSDGYVIYDASHKVSGDSLYSLDGAYGLPFGYVVITELSTPDNYQVSNSKYSSNFDKDISGVIKILSDGVSYSYFDGTKTTNGSNVYYKTNKKKIGEATLIKTCTSAYQSVVEDHPAYSLAGAVYTIYTDIDCTEEATDIDTGKTAALTTIADGSTNTVTLTEGTYYVKETKSSPGYLLDTSVKTVSVENDKCAEITSTEVPIIYTANLILKKTTEANTNASLEGAVFEVQFYAGATGAGGSATKTWYLTSDANGDVKFNRNYLATDYTSSSFYYDSGNNICLPIGYLVITEVEAPTGFVKTSDTVTYTLTGTGWTISNGTEEVSGTASTTDTTTIDNDKVQEAGFINNILAFGGVSVDKMDAEASDGSAQGDSSLEGFTFDIISQNDYAVTVNDGENKSYSKGEVVLTITTDENGHAESGNLLQAGFYTVVESGQGDGYSGTGINTSKEIEISKNEEIISCEVTNYVLKGGLSVQKYDYMLDESADHGDTDLSGAEFTIINASDAVAVNKDGNEIPTSGLSGSEVTRADVEAAIESGCAMQTITTGADGSASTGTSDLPYGTYYVIETKAATGYFLNETWAGRVEVREGGVIYAAQTIQDSKSGQETTAQQIYRSGISLIKADLEMQDGTAQGEACFEGAEFTIINVSDTLVMNADGTEIPSAKSLVSDSPAYDELRALADDGSYTVQVITTDENGQAATGINDLPYGTYYVIETKSSCGYWIDEDFIGLAVIREDSLNLALGSTSESGLSYFIDINDTESNLASSADQQVRRKDLSFIKVDIDGNYKSCIPFLITAVAVDGEGNETELESHVIVSDANGYVDTSRTHSANTNGFDQYVVDGAVTAEGEALLEEASAWGIWFQGNGTMDTADMTVTDSYGALYTCYYRITELQCENNSGLSENLLNSGLIYLYNDTGDLTELLSDNAQMYMYHPLVDTEIVLTSDALDVQSGTQVVSANESVEVTDAVSFTHVSADHTYRMETQFVDITAGNKVLAIIGTNDEDAAVSDDGLWVTKEFQPEKQSGTNNTYGDITMSALLDTSGLYGHTIVAVDYLYQYVNIDSTTGYWVLVAVHEDYTDEDQMLYVPDIHTNAADGLTGSRAGAADEGDYIIDTVTYTNLASKTNYVLLMYVADAETGEAVVTNADGTPYTVKARIMSNSTAAMISGTKTMPYYYIDSSEYSGKTLVVIETLYLADEDDNPYGDPVIEATSILDEDETIRYPEVHTSASDSLTLDNVGMSSETAVVYDEVVIENVVFDNNDLDGQYTYTVTGTLVYQQDFMDADGVSHKAGEAVETLDGTIDTVTITSDAAGNATFICADGTTANGKVTITGYGRNAAKTIGGDEEDNSYVTDSTAAVATITVELVYLMDSSKLEGGTAVVFEDLYHEKVKVASHADLTDEGQSVHYPEVKTSAVDDSTLDEAGNVQVNASITDTVILTNLVPGRAYTVTGKLVNQSDGSVLTVNGEIVTQSVTITVGDGTITASNGEKTTATAYDADYSIVSGTVDLTFNFDASGLAGETVVVFEDLIYNGVTVATHADITDESQTVHFPEIHTLAADGLTADSVAAVSSEAVLVDTVIYSNLVPGKEYTVSGILVNKDTGWELADADNRAVTAERTFTAGATEEGITADIDEAANSVSGTVDLTFIFNASLLEGTTVVAFESLEHNSITVATHCDINDEDETIHFPKVQTSAIDTTVGDEVGNTGETVIVDTVSLWNLVPGMTYTVSGVLMDKDTGEALLVNGETVTQSATVTVNEDGTVAAENGENIGNVVYDEVMNSVDCTVDLVYKLDASTLAGVTTVVFEDLYHNDVIVASHADIKDLGQSAHFPEIHTTATDLDTSGHVGTVEEEAVINDVVYFTNLVAGKEYTLTGTLMNRRTGLPLLDGDGAEITASVTFTAETESSGDYTVTEYHEDNNSVDGTYLLTFTLDSSLLAGKTVVVFESLYHNGVEVTVHADISDDNQSVYYPDIHTTAVDTNTGDHVGTIWGALINFARSLFGQETEEDAKQVITDTVALGNLVPGQTYVVSGKLYNATESLTTGEDTPLVIDGEEITRAVTITVAEDGKNITAADGSATSVTAYNEDLNSVDGTVDLVYTLDGSKIQGIEVVVFEKLYQDASYTSETNPEEVPEEDLVNEHSDIEDEGQSVSEISIRTTAVDTTTGNHVGAVPDGTSITSIHDEVNLAGLVSGMEYTVDGVLVSLGDSDLSTGEIYYLKADGTLTDDREEAYTETLTFTAEETTETYYLNFAISSDKVQGRSLTVFENIYHNDTLISSHPTGDGDGWDEEFLAEQTVYYPAGKTNATDTTTDEHMSLADENRTIVDRVYFENLLVGQEYTITGQLVYKEAFADADGVSHAAGEAVTEAVAVSFTASEDLASASYADGREAAVDSVTATVMMDGQTVVSGYVSISFTVDASKLAGASLAAFEIFSHDGADIFTHDDLNDLPQTIKIPAIGTTANVLDLDEAAIYDMNGNFIDIMITDTVMYENLWTAEELASMAEQAKYIEYLDGTYRTQDSAIYTVSEDAAYMLKGVLMDKATGEALVNSSGNTYTVYSEAFTPESEDGSYDVKFVINAGDFLDEDGGILLAGATLVVYEDLYLAATEDEATEEKHVAEHHDIDDVEQDIRIPDGRTHATDGVSGTAYTEDVVNALNEEHAGESAAEHEAEAGSSMTITDLVAYENLHGNTAYTVTGTLQVVTAVDSEGVPTAWEVAAADDGNEITAAAEFTTGGSYDDSVSGTVALTFTFSGLRLAGKTLVAFETVSRNGTAVFVHADITDEAQTVTILAPQAEISKQDVTTGEELPGATLIVKDEGGNEIEQWVSTDEPHTFRLPTGTYTLTEITAPDGYEVAETITFEIKDGEALTSVVMYDSPEDTTTGTASVPKTGDWFRYAVPIVTAVLGILLLIWHRRRLRVG
ncbi:MAG: VaFE repeat-containing surface-anchored protein [Lachnospiraceae bacterium]|nr:VaFE repeat-containing surface-anchored protein [Lachnospiraceae bacterium]